MPIRSPIHTNSQSIDRVLQAGLPVILVFRRAQCQPCQQLQPTLERLARDYAGRLLIAGIDIDDEPDLGRQYHIEKLPGLVFIREGRPVAQSTGAAPESALRAWCDYLTRGGAQPPLPQGPSIALQPGAAASPRPAASPKNNTKPVQLTDANFDQFIQGPLPVLVDFWAPWCGPCHMIAPTIESLAAETAGRLKVGKLNVDNNQRTAARYGVMSIPTLIIFRNGEVIDRVTGALPAQHLRQRVLAHLR